MEPAGESPQEDVGLSALVQAVRSQTLSDTYPVRQRILDRNPIFVRLYRLLTSRILGAIINSLYAQVLDHTGFGRLFVRSPKVKLLCDHQCSLGHNCRYEDGHRGQHVCVFGHVGDLPVRQCNAVCDARGCDGECYMRPGHAGPHKCYFRHYLADIPTTNRDANAFQDDKAIGDYVTALAYSTAEDMRFAHIPEHADADDAAWME
uniref:Gsp-co-occurring protein 12 n=1 Tax=Malawimonas jakobiformis TaxID=136089 RepID=A0A895KR52_MALJA|nr:Gsp-co-occurring protein 12 [Malawimonas jakobiformis]